ncbi:hypothetical protein GCM10022255_093490 [Dactylosporangium darangshiense]|uniref:Uncharacterized protein n=1 Tax=Dactylosporangium darangshiense TaxID=579108 RepID=A0ABP8DPS6_9ACTN
MRTGWGAAGQATINQGGVPVMLILRWTASPQRLQDSATGDRGDMDTVRPHVTDAYRADDEHVKPPAPRPAVGGQVLVGVRVAVIAAMSVARVTVAKPTRTSPAP